VIQFLNIADCTIGSDGLRIIAPALRKNKSLVALNLSNNELDTIEPLFDCLNKGRNLLELTLSHNTSLGDSALKTLTDLFDQNNCVLKRLYLQGCRITSIGAGMLFEAL
jgi:Ran GTPase-activating protein (RanGAP) involved in mRNA processing and transport